MKGFWTKNSALALMGVGGFAAGVLVMTNLGCGSAGVGGSKVLAEVNGEKITEEDWHTYLETKPRVNVRDQNGQSAEAPVAETLGYQAFQDLLRQKLIMQLAKDEGVAPTEADVEKEIEFKKKQTANFMTLLTQQGFTLKDIKEALMVDLARERVLTKGIDVKPEHVDRFIETNPKQFIEPAQANMLWIFVKTKERQKTVDADLVSGQSFAAVSARYSEHDGARQSAQFPTTTIAQLPAPIQKIANGLKDAQTSEWLTLSDGFAKFYMEKKTEAKRMKIDDVMKETVRRSLALQRGIQAIDLDTRLLEKMKASKITVNKDTIKTKWDDALEKLKDLEERRSEGGAKPADDKKATP